MTDASASPGRSYARAVDLARALEGDLETRMQRVCDILWDEFSPQGYSWVGFYTAREGDQEMVLGPRRDKPACSPIGLHGACGQAFLNEDAMVVHDVKSLGASYIACDPRDQSEVVLAVFDEAGEPWGVLDVDSFDVGAFDERDVEGLREVLVAARLTHEPDPAPTRHV